MELLTWAVTACDWHVVSLSVLVCSNSPIVFPHVMSFAVEPLQALIGLGVASPKFFISHYVFLQSLERRCPICSLCAVAHTCPSNFRFLCNRQALTLLSLQQRLCNKLKSIFLIFSFNPWVFYKDVCMCVFFYMLPSEDHILPTNWGHFCWSSLL